MVNTCCVVGCSKRSGRDVGVSFYSIPAIIENQGDRTKDLSLERRQAWIAKIRREGWVPSKSSRVCSEHFLSGESMMYIHQQDIHVALSISGKPSLLYDTQNPDWAPTQKMGYKVSQPDVGRYSRLEERRKRRKVESSSESCGAANEEIFSSCSNSETLSPAMGKDLVVDAATQTDEDCVLDELHRVKHECVHLQKRVTMYEKMTLSEESLKHNEQKLKFYTGMCVF